MKKFFTLLCCLAASAALTASAQGVRFTIGDGTDDEALKGRIERNVTALLTEINAAQSAGRSLDFSNIDASQSAQSSLSMLWANVPFRCFDEEIVERLLQVPDGYQVRNIPLELKPVGVAVNDDSYQEAVIDFNRTTGRIESFYFAISNNLYAQVMRSNLEVNDMRRRQLILDYVEHFRTAYNQKDLNFLQQVFSDDAIIITGKVTRTRPTDFNPIPKEKITYTTQSKVQYLNNLRGVFSRNRYIRVNFSEIKVSRHPARADFYGVLLRQGYNSSTYSDDGYVFLLWDFSDEAHPQIHVRTWQPYYLDTAKKTPISEDEIFDISTFEL